MDCLGLEHEVSRAGRLVRIAAGRYCARVEGCNVHVVRDQGLWKIIRDRSVVGQTRTLLEARHYLARLGTPQRSIPDASRVPDAAAAAVTTRTWEVSELTLLEHDVLERLHHGATATHIATSLRVSASTITSRIRSLKAKLGVRSCRQAVAVARHRGLVHG